MGDPKRLRKKFATPNHPWNKTAIEQEAVLKREFGLRNKREIMIANSFLKKYKNLAKRLIPDKSAQAQKEAAQVLEKLQNLGIISQGASLADILATELKDVLNRRLASVVARKGLARSVKQARQFIVHRHVRVAEKEITSPSYLVSLEEEAQITFKEKSTLSDENHPERVNLAKEIKDEKEKTLNPKGQEAQEEDTGVVEPAEDVE